MNCFSHALPFLSKPYLAVGCCLPDWLSACDRKCRAREKSAIEFINHPDSVVAQVAQGVVRHHQDDAWFHQSRCFNEMMLKFSVELKSLFGQERTMRPGLLGHVLIELFIDAFLHREHPGKLDYFYKQTEEVDPEAVQAAINLFANRPTEKLANEVVRFRREKYLYDYSTDRGIVFRINKVFKRIKLQPLGDEMLGWMPSARQRVYDKIELLLPNYPIAVLGDAST